MKATGPIRTLVCNGWAAGLATWSFCTFEHDWIFSYLEQLDGLPERVIEGSDGVVLVGFSLGGANALRLTLRYPEKIRGLVLVSATPRMTEEQASGWKGMGARRIQALSLGTRLVYRNDPDELYAPDNLQRGLDFLSSTDLRDALLARFVGGAPFPVAILQGERDGIVRPNNADFLQRVFPAARVTRLPGLEHVLPVLAPEAVDAAVAWVRAAAGIRPESSTSHAPAP